MIAMSASAVVLGYSINNSRFLIASTCIVLFIASFSIGLGPIPFVLMGEVPPIQASRILSPHHAFECSPCSHRRLARPQRQQPSYVLSSPDERRAMLTCFCIAQGVNWLSNFCVVSPLASPGERRPLTKAPC